MGLWVMGTVDDGTVSDGNCGRWELWVMGLWVMRTVGDGNCG